MRFLRLFVLDTDRELLARVLPSNVRTISLLPGLGVGLKNNRALLLESLADGRERHMLPAFYIMCDRGIDGNKRCELITLHQFKAFFSQSRVVTSVVSDLVEDGALQEFIRSDMSLFFRSVLDVPFAGFP